MTEDLTERAFEISKPTGRFSFQFLKAWRISPARRGGMVLAIPWSMRDWTARCEWIDRLEKRTARFFEDVIGLCKQIRDVPGLENASRQLIKSANVASNHLVMRRGRSDREFAAKLQIVHEEIVESVGWLELIEKVLDRPDATVRDLTRESRELRAIFGKAKKTMNERLDTQEQQRRRR